MQDRESEMRLQQFRQVTLMLRGKMDDDRKRQAAILGDVVQKRLERGKASGGRSDAYHRGSLSRLLRLHGTS